MRLEKLTIKAQEALQAAHELAASRAHQELTPEHVLAALLDHPHGIAGAILRKLGVDPGPCASRWPRRWMRSPR